MTSHTYMLNKIKNHRVLLFLTLFVFLSVYIFFTFKAYNFELAGESSLVYETYYSIDSYYTYLPAKCMTEIPETIFTILTGPMAAIISFPFVQIFDFGFTTLRLVNSVFAVGSLFLVYKICRRFELKPLTSIAVISATGTSVLYFFMSRSGLSGVPLTFFLLGSIYFYLNERTLLSVLFASILPMIRGDGLVALILIAILYLKKRKFRILPLLFVPLISWFVLSKIYLGNLFFPYTSELKIWSILVRFPGPQLRITDIKIITDFLVSIGIVTIPISLVGLITGIHGNPREYFSVFFIPGTLFLTLISLCLLTENPMLLRYFYLFVPFSYILMGIGLEKIYSTLIELSNKQISIILLSLLLSSVFLINLSNIRNKNVDITKSSIILKPDDWEEYKNDLLSLRDWIDNFYKKKNPKKIYGPTGLYIIDTFDKKCRYWDGFYVYNSMSDVNDVNNSLFGNFYPVPPMVKKKIEEDSLFILKEGKGINECKDISEKMEKIREFEGLNLTVCKYGDF